jgi:hypothetical protein
MMLVCAITLATGGLDQTGSAKPRGVAVVGLSIIVASAMRIARELAPLAEFQFVKSLICDQIVVGGINDITPRYIFRFQAPLATASPSTATGGRPGL